MNTTLILTALTFGQVFINTTDVDVRVIHNETGALAHQTTGVFDMRVDITDQSLLEWGTSLSVDDPDFVFNFVWDTLYVPAEPHPTHENEVITASMYNRTGSGSYTFGESSAPLGELRLFSNRLGGEYPGDGNPPRLDVSDTPDDMTILWWNPETDHNKVAFGNLNPNASRSEYRIEAHWPLSPRDTFLDFDPVTRAGDLNDDGYIDAVDLNMVLFHWGGRIIPIEWVNEKPFLHVGASELNSVLFNWASASSSASVATVPEPTGLALLLLAVPTVLTLSRR